MTVGNPPSGAAGGYGWFDLVGLLLAPYLLLLLQRIRTGLRPIRGPVAGPPEPEPVDAR